MKDIKVEKKCVLPSFSMTPRQEKLKTMFVTLKIAVEEDVDMIDVKNNINHLDCLSKKPLEYVDCAEKML